MLSYLWFGNGIGIHSVFVNLDVTIKIFKQITHMLIKQFYIFKHRTLCIFFSSAPVNEVNNLLSFYIRAIFTLFLSHILVYLIIIISFFIIGNKTTKIIINADIIHWLHTIPIARTDIVKLVFSDNPIRMCILSRCSHFKSYIYFFLWRHIECHIF